MKHSLIDDIPGNKRSLSKFKNIEIISSIFSDHNGMKSTTNRNEVKKNVYVETKQHPTLKKKRFVTKRGNLKIP